MDTSIQHVVETMVIEDAIDAATAKSRREGLERKIHHGFFLPFELTHSDADDQIKDLKAVEERAQMKAKGYRPLDYTFLAWRREQNKLPVFAVFDAKSSVNFFHISISTREWHAENIRGMADVNYRFSPELPSEIAFQYRDTIVHLGKKIAASSRVGSYELSASLPSGFIPDTLREQIKRAWRVFDSIFVIAEAKFKLNAIFVPKGDPLVVGWKKGNSTMYLIGKYDPTPLETYVEEQFTED